MVGCMGKGYERHRSPWLDVYPTEVALVVDAVQITRAALQSTLDISTRILSRGVAIALLAAILARAITVDVCVSVYMYVGSDALHLLIEAGVADILHELVDRRTRQLRPRKEMRKANNRGRIAAARAILRRLRVVDAVYSGFIHIQEILVHGTVRHARGPLAEFVEAKPARFRVVRIEEVRVPRVQWHDENASTYLSRSNIDAEVVTQLL